jgi:RHS repeat-associated protein
LTGINYVKGATTLGNLTYSYDSAGQRTGMGGSFARTVLPTAVTSGVYDANNRLTTWGSKTLTYDVNGNLTGDGTYTYTWNARDQLIRVNQGVTILGQYAYDASGRRYSRTLGTTATKYLYDGDSAVRETVGTANTDLFGAGIDNYFSRTDASGTQSFLTDALGSVLALGNASGVLDTSYTFGPYGQTQSTGLASANSNQYTSREKDVGDLYFYRARYYSSDLNRFISQDPIGLGGGLNWYSYTRGNPISFSDYSGLVTVVLYGHGIATNPFGHIAVGFTGKGVYTFGTQTLPGSSMAAYINSQSSYRGTTAYFLNTTPEQEAMMLKKAKSYPFKLPGLSIKYLSDDCATRTYEILDAGGVIGHNEFDFLFPPYYSSFPINVISRIDPKYIISINDFPKR